MKGVVFSAVIIFCVLSFFIIKKQMVCNAQKILPQACVFSFKKGLSSAFQTDVAHLIEKEYQDHKDPHVVIDKINQTFPEISDMKAHICQTDKICFTLDLITPLFLLNGSRVVCEQAVILDAQHLSREVIAALPEVTGPEKDAACMVQFFAQLPEALRQHFSIHWVSGAHIELTQRNDEAKNSNNKQPVCTYLACASLVPTSRDIDLCRSLQEQQAQTKNKKKNITYDVRFKNQIIVR